MIRVAYAVIDVIIVIKMVCKRFCQAYRECGVPITGKRPENYICASLCGLWFLPVPKPDSNGPYMLSRKLLLAIIREWRKKYCQNIAKFSYRKELIPIKTSIYTML